MEAKVTHAAGRIYRAHRFDMVVGQTCEVELTGTAAPISWSAGDDEVLAIEDDNGLTAKITATSIGASIIFLLRGKRPIGVLRIGVYEDPTVTVDFSFGNVRPVDAP